MPEEKHVSADELKERLTALQTPVAHAAGKPHKHVQLRQVETFATVLALGTVSKAATELGISTSAVSQAIADLEQNLGASLFEHYHRGSRHLDLTPAGKLLAEKGKELLAVEAEIRSAIEAHAVSPRHSGQRKTFASKAPQPRRDLRNEQNAGDVLGTVAFIESRAAGSDVRFPKALVDELERALPDLGTSRESVERMTALLDLMQVSVTPENEQLALLDPANRAGTAFRERHEASERIRTRQSKDSSGPRHR